VKGQLPLHFSSECFGKSNFKGEKRNSLVQPKEFIIKTQEMKESPY